MANSLPGEHFYTDRSNGWIKSSAKYYGRKILKENLVSVGHSNGQPTVKQLTRVTILS